MRFAASIVARYALATVCFAGVFTLFFSPVLLGHNYLTTVGDGSNIALPEYLVPHGLWEPDIMLGYPWASNFNGGWDPLFALHLVPHSFNGYMLAAYVIAAVGAFGCVDVLRGSTIGGVVAGLSYALGGFMIEHLGHYDIVHPAAWTPWIFCALLAQRRSTGVWPIVLGSTALALCALAGQPQVVTYTLLFSVGYIVFIGMRGPLRRRYVARALAMVLLGIGAAAIALVPGLLLALSSFRAHASLDYFLSFSLPPWQIPIRLLFPYILGQSSQPVYPFSSVGIGSNAELSAYVGIATLILGICAILTRRGDREVLFFALASAIALLLSTGDGFHIETITYHVPVFNLFRAQGRNLLEFTLFSALLGGVGAAEIASGNVRLCQLALAIGAVGFALLITGVFVMSSGRLPVAANTALGNPAFFIPACTFVIASIVITLFQRARHARLAAIALALCTLADVSTFAWFQSWRLPVTEGMVAPSAASIALRASLEPTHQRMFSVSGGMTLAGLPPNLNLLWGVPAAGGYVQMLLTSPGIFLQLLPQGTMSPELLANGTDQSLDLAAVRYIVLPIEEAPALIARHPSWHLIKKSSLGEIVENTRAQPRVRLVHRVVALSPDATLSMIRHGLLDPREVAIPPGGGTLDTRSDETDSALITDLEAELMRVNVTCRTPCFLETSDTYNSSWQAAVDGVRVPLRLTDYALRGIFVPAGNHAITFVYRPWSITLGASVTIIGVSIIVALIVVSALASTNTSIRRSVRFLSDS